MTPPLPSDREARIVEAAYEVLAEKGYGGASMLVVAKRARASNETLYRWYGDKRGLFARLIVLNTTEVEATLDAAAGSATGMDGLRAVAPVLLTLLTGDRAIALNRAAAADATGELGAVLAQMGRDRLAPRIQHLIDRATLDGAIDPAQGTDRLGLFLDLLVGDLQIRRVIGALPAPDEKTTAARAAMACDRFARLLSAC